MVEDSVHRRYLSHRVENSTIAFISFSHASGPMDAESSEFASSSPFSRSPFCQRRAHHVARCRVFKPVCPEILRASRSTGTRGTRRGRSLRHNREDRHREVTLLIGRHRDVPRSAGLKLRVCCRSPVHSSHAAAIRTGSSRSSGAPCSSRWNAAIRAYCFKTGIGHLAVAAEARPDWPADTRKGRRTTR